MDESEVPGGTSDVPESSPDPAPSTVEEIREKVEETFTSSQGEVPTEAVPAEEVATDDVVDGVVEEVPQPDET